MRLFYFPDHVQAATTTTPFRVALEACPEEARLARACSERQRAEAESIPLFAARQREFNTKRRGGLAEFAFILKAASRQFGVSNSVA